MRSTRIGSHGRLRTGDGDRVFGHLLWDNADHVEVRFLFHSTHFHRLDETLIVGDGTSAFRDNAELFIRLFKWDGGQ